MISKLSFILSECSNPYHNMALEEYLLSNVENGECILYLWQNDNTVVIGKNQNCWKECNVTILEEDGGFLARRLSGGGAVYHDMGNLNFTFCVAKENFNLDKQLDVILEAVKALGIHAEKTGRNDLTIDGKKFSGNAFYNDGKHSYHHGTIMIHVDVEKMSKYLNVDKEKLSSKGVESVKSRVSSLEAFAPGVGVKDVIKSLKQSFSQVYGLPIERDISLSPDDEVFDNLIEKFKSWDWKYGQKIPFDYQISRRFQWGGIQLQLHVEKGKVSQANLFSDAMDQLVIEKIAEAIIGNEYSVSVLRDAVKSLKRPENSVMDDEYFKMIITDFASTIEEEI